MTISRRTHIRCAPVGRHRSTHGSSLRGSASPSHKRAVTGRTPSARSFLVCPGGSPRPCPVSWPGMLRPGCGPTGLFARTGLAPPQPASRTPIYRRRPQRRVVASSFLVRFATLRAAPRTTVPIPRMAPLTMLRGLGTVLSCVRSITGCLRREATVDAQAHAGDKA